MARALKPYFKLFSMLGLVALLGATQTACSRAPYKKKAIAQPLYYLDNTLPFQPKRLWRVIVRWEPYLLDAKKAIVVKEFQLLAHDERERQRIEGDILARGGDTLYLNWLESSVFPIGIWEKRDEARVSRYVDMLMVVLVTKAIKEVPQEGMLSLVDAVELPDPLLAARRHSCGPLSWDVLPRDDSVGLEVVLESRREDPRAEKWNRFERDLPNFYARTWSVGQERRMAYRTFLHAKTNVSRCPLPPKIDALYEQLARGQAMGVEW